MTLPGRGLPQLSYEQEERKEKGKEEGRGEKKEGREGELLSP